MALRSASWQITLSGIDVVLGIQFLKTVGPTLWDSYLVGFRGLSHGVLVEERLGVVAWAWLPE